MKLIDGSEFDVTLDVLDLFILWMVYEKSNVKKSPFKTYIKSFSKESSIPFSVGQNGKFSLNFLKNLIFLLRLEGFAFTVATKSTSRIQ